MRILSLSLVIAALATPVLAAPASGARLIKTSARVERPRHQPVMETMTADRGLTALLSDRQDRAPAPAAAVNKGR